MELQGNQKSQLILKKNKAGLPNCKFYYKTVVTKTWWYPHKNRHTGQWNRLKNPKVTSYVYGQLTFYKRVETIQWGSSNLFDKQCWDD